MEDPVVDPEGNTYERRAIEEWLSRNSTSPVTRSPLSVTDLVPNRALRDAIEQSRNGGTARVAVAAKEIEQLCLLEEEEVGEEEVTMAMTAVKGGEGQENEAVVMVTAVPPEGRRRRATDIVCVVDVSGSMGVEASVQNEQGAKEAHGLSVLDVVKHAVRTVINALGESDRLALVAYSTTARTVLDLLPMNAAGRKKAEAALNTLQPDGQTNLWDGLHTGLEILRKKAEVSGRLGAVLLLTDGQPNVEPPRGHIPALRKYKDQHGCLSGSVNTFGFGYGLDSKLLTELAAEGDGMYGFIPDSGLVGTVFVNATANLLVTLARGVQLSLEPLNGAALVDQGVLGGVPTTYTSWGAQVSAGAILHGQPRHVVAKLRLPGAWDGTLPLVHATLKYNTRYGAKQTEVECCAVEEGSRDVDAQRVRLTVVDTVQEVMRTACGANTASGCDASGCIVEAAVRQLKAEPVAVDVAAPQHAFVAALVQDLDGQVREAVSKAEFFTRWGRHYLPSLGCAHALEECNNFKDAGVQFYGGALFRSIRDAAEDIFCKLPPPKPSAAYRGATSHAPVSMAGYYNRSGGCFHGDSMVRLAHGTEAPISSLRKGTAVRLPSGGHTNVLCVVVTPCPSGHMDLVRVSSRLVLTPYHPVRVGASWVFPCDVAVTTRTRCAAVYNLVLDGGHVVVVDGIECVTLGHGLEDNDVVRHPYFGTQRVIEDLERLYGWHEGLVTLAPQQLARDPTSSHVVGLQPELRISVSVGA